MGHIHAAAMAEYAEDVLETDKPWERRMFSSRPPSWISFTTSGPLHLAAQQCAVNCLQGI